MENNIKKVLDKKTITHRRCVKEWKEKNREKHLEHRRRQNVSKKIKFIFLNILL